MSLRLAYIHVLPLEYYPPALNSLTVFTKRNDWSVRVWTTGGRRGEREWAAGSAAVTRHRFPDDRLPLPLRIAGYAAWHLRTAAELARWKPDAIMYVEPHSALAVWLYYHAFGGAAPLFIHHHEYYAPADYRKAGNRLLRAIRRLERDDLLSRAVWVSQTNARRLQLACRDNPGIQAAAAKVLPNYPPEAWGSGAKATPVPRLDTRLRLIYVGSASLRDTFIGEIAEWVSRSPATRALHVCGNNVQTEVWQRLRALDAANITLQPEGVAYADLPDLLASFDVGLVLYRGNTLNFVHNVPNKAIEYLRSGLEVWYPREMQEMTVFATDNPDLALREVDFQQLPLKSPAQVRSSAAHGLEAFAAEKALMPLLDTIAREATRG